MQPKKGEMKMKKVIKWTAHFFYFIFLLFILISAHQISNSKSEHEHGVFSI